MTIPICISIRRKSKKWARPLMVGFQELLMHEPWVNTSGSIEDVGYSFLLHAIDSIRITVVLVLGHDRLYCMLGTISRSKYNKTKLQ